MIFIVFLQVKVLSNFPGLAQTKGNQPKLLRKILDFIVDRTFLAKFSYTGKLVKGQKRKISFSQKKNIVDLLYAIASKVDKTYEKDDLKTYLRDKILKHAAE